MAPVLEPPRLGQLLWQIFSLLLSGSISLRPIIKCVYLWYLSSRQLVLIHPLASITLHVHYEQSNSRLVHFLEHDEEDEDDSSELDASAGRFVRYQFTPAFLRLRTVGAT